MPPEKFPRVSIVIACRNAGAYIDAAIGSARAQTLDDIEILIVDDGSGDDTRARAARHAEQDIRITLLDGPAKGPGAARNVALAVARGEWIAILDADDLMHPRRLEWLLREIGDTADIVADNLVAFFDPPDGRIPYLVIDGAAWSAAREIDLGSYILANQLFTAEMPLGYLKPLIRRDMLGRLAGSYDESLRIGEDYDLIARLLAGGARFRFLPTPLYFYRRHPHSTSFRMGAGDIAALLAADRLFCSALAPSMHKFLPAADDRRASLLRALHFSTAIEAIKRREWPRATGILLRHPSAAALAIKAVQGGVTRRLREKFRRPAASPAPRHKLVLATAPPAAAQSSDSGIRRLIFPAPGDGDLPSLAAIRKICDYVPVEAVSCEDAALRDLEPYALIPGERSCS